MSMMNRRSFSLSAALGVSAGMIGQRGLMANTEWLGWRGNSRDGFIDAEAWPKSLSADNLTLQWERPLDSGYSGPLVSGSKVFVTETRSKQNEAVSALELSSGETAWKAEWPGAMTVPFFAKSNGDWIRSTPVCDGKRLYVGGMRDVVVALDLASGQEVWRVDFAEQFNTPLPSFGLVCSPLIDGDRLYIQAGGGLAAIESDTGKILWQALEDGGGMNGGAFSSPIIATLHSRRQLLVQTRQALVGIDLESGQELWRKNIEAFRGMNILTPTVWDNCVFTSSYGGKSWLLELEPRADGPWKVSDRWENKSQGYMSSPVVIDHYLYLHLRNQRLVCLDLNSGEECWKTKPYGKYWSMLTNGREILALDQRGTLMLIEHNPEQFALLDEREVSSQETWAHLALVGDQMLVRHLKGIQLYRWSA